MRYLLEAQKGPLFVFRATATALSPTRVKARADSPVSVRANSPSASGQTFKDPMTTATAIYRVVHHSVILEPTNQSVRGLETAARAGVTSSAHRCSRRRWSCRLPG